MKLPVEPAIDLLHRAPAATLATHSATLPGYPYATVVPNVVDEHHRPLLCISALAEHTRNLLADPRVSVSVVAPEAPNVQAATRLTLVGDAERFDPTEAQLARYLRYHPEAADYLGLDFMFFRIRPCRVRCIEGVGRMGWFEAGDWEGLPWLVPEDEARWLAAASPAAAAGLRVLGADPLGVDYERDGRRGRSPLAARPSSNSDLAAVLRETISAIMH